MTFGERLKEIRNKISEIGKDSQSDMAKRMGAPQNTYSRYERSQKDPPAWVLVKLCKEFDINPEWLLLGTGEMKRGESSQKTENSTSERTKDRDSLIEGIWSEKDAKVYLSHAILNYKRDGDKKAYKIKMLAIVQANLLEIMRLLDLDCEYEEAKEISCKSTKLKNG